MAENADVLGRRDATIKEPGSPIRALVKRWSNQGDKVVQRSGRPTVEHGDARDRHAGQDYCALRKGG